MLGDYIANGELIPVLLENNSQKLAYNLYALYHPGHYQDPKIRSFIDFIVKKISMSPSWDNWMN